jgi:hypothetical protein
MSESNPALSFDDRLLLAREQVARTQETRSGFLSDDDLLDAVDEFTISAPARFWTSDDDGADYEHLRDALFEMVLGERA